MTRPRVATRAEYTVTNADENGATVRMEWQEPPEDALDDPYLCRLEYGSTVLWLSYEGVEAFAKIFALLAQDGKDGI